MIETTFGGSIDTELLVLTGTSVTTLLEADQSDYLVHTISYASETGDTLTLDTFDGSTAARLRQAAIATNADSVFETPFVLKRGHNLRGALTTGNATAIRVTYTIRNS